MDDRCGNSPGSGRTNTTIAVVASNANLNKVQANKVAQMAHNGLAKTIHPVHTLSGGDTMGACLSRFALSDIQVRTSHSLMEKEVRTVFLCQCARRRKKFQ